MWKTLILSLALLAALVPTASAARDLCQTVCPTPCNGNNVCVIVRTSPQVCAGVGFGLQGVMGCADPATGCATVYIGFNKIPLCSALVLP